MKYIKSCKDKERVERYFQAHPETTAGLFCGGLTIAPPSRGTHRPAACLDWSHNPYDLVPEGTL